MHTGRAALSVVQPGKGVGVNTMKAKELFTQQYGLKDPALLEELCALAEVRTMPRGTVFLRAGQVQTCIYLLLSGVARGYFLDMDGGDHTDCFCFRCGTPTMPPCSFDEPSPINLAALTDCDFVVMPLQQTMELVRRYPALTELYARFLTDAMRLHNHTRHVMCSLTARQRFEWFLEEYPGLIFDVSNRQIASFLNMTPETLSRMKSALRKSRYAEWQNA